MQENTQLNPWIFTPKQWTFEMTAAVPILRQMLEDGGGETRDEEGLQILHGLVTLLVAITAMLQEDVGASGVHTGRHGGERQPIQR